MDAAPLTGEGYRLGICGSGNYFMTADRTANRPTFTLIIGKHITTMGTSTCTELIRFHMDRVAAITLNIAFGEETGFGRHIFATAGTFNHKLRYIDISFLSV